MIFYCTSCILELPIRSPGFLLLKSSLEIKRNSSPVSKSFPPQVLYFIKNLFWWMVFRCPTQSDFPVQDLNFLLFTKTDRRTGSQSLTFLYLKFL